MSLFIQQTKTIVQKNFQFYIAKKKEILKELLVPIISALVFYVGRPQQQSEDDELKTMNSMFSLMLPIYLPTTITGFAKKHLISFVQEKHERYKETQKIMGLTQNAYISGWLLTSYLMILPIGIITIFSLYYSGYGEGNFSMIAVNYTIYLITSVHQTYAISTFFSSPKLAGEIGVFFLSITSLVYFYISYGAHKLTQISLNIQVSDFTYALVCLSPQTAISFSVLSGSTSIENVQVGNSYSQNIATSMLIFDAFFYLILYFYLDEVIPNEYGLSRSPFFIFHKKFWIDTFCNKMNLRKRNYSLLEDQINDNQNQQEQQVIRQQLLIEIPEVRAGSNSIPNDSLIQQQNQSNQLTDNQSNINIKKNSDQVSLDVTEISREQNQQTPLIKITDLKKHFGNVNAVNGISLNLYQSQILCLLGHNGAGKTTTISLLTGLIEKTSGSIKYFGEDLEQNIDQIRQQLGLCTQKDVLYDYLTVTQHLEFIASIKGLQSHEIKNEVQYIINEVGLIHEKDKFAENLSGGNKRKLSLGMSLVGGSKIIFLDEPTSGMDAVSRQQIWKILEKVRDQRAIVLTTHHLDEAERLSDRIAIMSKGKILIDGKSEQIKKEYGVGYHLTITCKQNSDNQLFQQNKSDIVQMVLTTIPGSQHNEQSGKDSLKFTLPFEQINLYSNLFQTIENLQYLNINLSINSLEDAFINIGIRDDVEAAVDPQHPSNAIRPESIFTSPTYSFFSQFKAMFLRQYYMTTRNWSAVLMILLPIGFILLGVYVSKHFLDNLEEYLKMGDEDGEEDKTAKELKKSFIFPLKMYFLNIFIVQAYTMNSSIYINTPVLEKEFQLKYALNVMGCRPFPYWLGTLAFDYLVYLLTFLIFFYSTYVVQVEFIIPYLTPLFLIMACFGFTLISFCYACGVFFQNSNSAFKYFPIIAYFISYTIPWIVLQVTRFSSDAVYSFFQYIFLVISPFLTLEKGKYDIFNDDNLYIIFLGRVKIYFINKIFSIEYFQNNFKCQSQVILIKSCSHLLNLIFALLYMFCNYSSKQNIQKDSFQFLLLQKALQNIDAKNRKGPINDNADFRNNQIFDSWEDYCWVLILESIVYFLFTIILEQQYYSLSNKSNQNILPNLEAQEDEGVLAERERVNNFDNTDPIKVQNLHKVFPNGTHAVSDTTFGVERGQIFGLLGPNGAGKSTTFNIITANISKSSGNVKLNGQEINENSSIYFNDIGVCPQNNCLWEYLNPKEHLKLFGRVKGLSGQQLKEVVNYYLKAMHLEQYKVKSANLSGGNKRKLCVTNSLIASPALQFFDEPSTGLDPIAKRQLWKCLNNILNKKESSIVLTTHSLQEAEDLCHKVGIQINGKFKCLDSLQNLKIQKGDGYKIYIKLNDQPIKNQEEINTKIRNVYQNAKILNQQDKSYEEYIIYQVPYEGFLFSQAFSLLQHNLKQNNIIEDFSITQASLEDIFVYLSQSQNEPQNNVEQQSKCCSLFSFRR